MQKEAWRLCEAPPFGTVINTTLEYPGPAAKSSTQHSPFSESLQTHSTSTKTFINRVHKDMSGIRASIVVTSSREYVVLASSDKKKQKNKKKSSRKIPVRLYTEKRLSQSESASFKKAPDNACVSLFTHSPESFAFLFQHAH